MSAPADSQYSAGSAPEEEEFLSPAIYVWFDHPDQQRDESPVDIRHSRAGSFLRRLLSRFSRN